MSNYEGMEGGELAASLSPAQRMEMVQRGYNPMSPDDVERYHNRQRPKDGLAEIAGVKEYKNLGGGVDATGKDAGLLQQFEQEHGASLVGGRSFGNESRNPRDEARSAMGNYGSNVGNLDDKISQISARSERREQRVVGPGPSRQQQRPQPQRQQLQQKTTSIPMVTEATKANKIGYVIGVRYINAFIANIKQPSSVNRNAMMEEMGKMNALESKIAPAVLKEYRRGIAQAEAEMYDKIKAAKGS